MTDRADGADGTGATEKADGADGGTYTLVVRLAAPATVAVGALGDRAFDAGWYAYTGSAFGPGGFARVERHLELAAGERDARHWHVDYLLGHPDASVETVVRTPGADVECSVGRALAADGATDPVDGFGASDCDCATHLVYGSEGDALRRAVESAHDGRGP